MSSHHKSRIGVLRGGPSPEYESSLETGRVLLSHLPESVLPVDLYIDRAGRWHHDGRESAPHEVLRRVDAVLNALHGAYGEDGGVQEVLEAYQMPFSGPRRLPAALSQNKALAKTILRKNGIQTPEFRVIRRISDDSLPALSAQLFRSFPQPSIVKPVRNGSSIGVSRVLREEDLPYALSLAFHHGADALIEEYIEGREVVCGVIEAFRNEARYTLLPAEIKTAEGAPLLEHSARQSGGYRVASPAALTESEKEAVQNGAARAHTLLGLRHYSSSDFIIHPTRGVYFLEIDALPSLALHSPFAASLAAIGCPIPHFTDHLISLAFGRK